MNARAAAKMDDLMEAGYNQKTAKEMSGWKEKR